MAEKSNGLGGTNPGPGEAPVCAGDSPEVVSGFEALFSEVDVSDFELWLSGVKVDFSSNIKNNQTCQFTNNSETKPYRDSSTLTKLANPYQNKILIQIYNN